MGKISAAAITGRGKLRPRKLTRKVEGTPFVELFSQSRTFLLFTVAAITVAALEITYSLVGYVVY